MVTLTQFSRSQTVLEVRKWLFCTLSSERWVHFNQTCKDILLGDGQEMFRFGDLGPTFKFISGLRMLENAFSAPLLQKEWIDFDQTDTQMLFGRAKEVITFG